MLMKETLAGTKLCTGGEKTSQFHISGWKGKMGKTTLGGTHKEILFHLFSQVKSKGLTNCLDTNMHLSKDRKSVV